MMLVLAELIKQLEKIETLTDLEEFHKAVLGKAGSLNEAFKQMKSLDDDAKKKLGQELSDIKSQIQLLYNQKEQHFLTQSINHKLEKELVDISIDTPKTQRGHYSLLTQARRELEDICKSMGFTIEYGPEMVTKYQNFESVNIPLSHPATEMQDTIYTNQLDASGEAMILRTHTSSAQNRLIKKYGAPLKIVVPGKVYRYEDLDATHDTMFYQLEGIVIDKNISIAHFKSMITKLLSTLLKQDVEIRIRPAYFPFVEPGFEIDARYEIIDRETGNRTKSKWIELIGAGMIHPNVLKNADVDPNEWSGFAFGIGVNRLVAIKNNIKDIRYFTNGDLRFAKSFC